MYFFFFLTLSCSPRESCFSHHHSKCQIAIGISVHRCFSYPANLPAGAASVQTLSDRWGVSCRRKTNRGSVRSELNLVWLFGSVRGLFSQPQTRESGDARWFNASHLCLLRPQAALNVLKLLAEFDQQSNERTGNGPASRWELLLRLVYSSYKDSPLHGVNKLDLCKCLLLLHLSLTDAWQLTSCVLILRILWKKSSIKIKLEQ